MSKSVRKSYHSKLLLLAAVVAIAVLAVLEATNTTHLLHKNTAATSPDSSKVITQLPHQPAANNGEKKSSASSTINQGTSTDNQGGGTATTPSSQWTTSDSGLLTVQQPVANSAISSGAIVSGTAKVDQVQYRLVDNQVGVISQGSISVVNGKFSASISFHAYGSSGRLDVFSTDLKGREINEVQIQVGLK